MVVDSLKFLLPEYQGEAEGEMPERLAGSAEEIEDDEKEAKAEEDKEEKVLATITALDRSGKGASWDEVVDEVKKAGIDKTELEEITNSLMDKGMIYEPVLGKMKRI